MNKVKSISCFSNIESNNLVRKKFHNWFFYESPTYFLHSCGAMKWINIINYVGLKSKLLFLNVTKEVKTLILILVFSDTLS